MICGGPGPPIYFVETIFVNKPLRVAFFADSFLEVNGAAMTCQRLVGYAQRNDFPFLAIYGGHKTESRQEGSVKFLELKRSFASVKLDEDLAYDPLFQRHTNRVLKAIVDFQPDIFHITGLNDVSILGSYLAWKLQKPLIASWHTNLHEFAALRLRRMFRFLPERFTDGVAGLAERKILDGAVLYYKMPKVVLAPNQELIDLLGNGTHRKALLMKRGVDAEKFSPQKRTVSDGIRRLGSVGRLRAEKNVRMFVKLEKALIAKGISNYEFLIVGEGNEREYLQKKLKKAKFTGFLAGEKLSEAYANMDIFLFPSETDAYGNVAQEAAASGVPSIVTDKGGPKFIVKHGETGYIAANQDDFISHVVDLIENTEKLNEMRTKSREGALANSWDSVFAEVYRGYDETLRIVKEKIVKQNNL